MVVDGRGSAHGRVGPRGSACFTVADALAAAEAACRNCRRGAHTEQVAGALRLVGGAGPNGRGACQPGTLARPARDARGGGSRRGGGLERLAEEADDVAWAGLGVGVRDRWTTERGMHAEFRRRLAARLRALSEELAAITLSFVTTQLLQASDIEGVRLTRLCAELGRQVSVHYEREAIPVVLFEQFARLTEQDEAARRWQRALRRRWPAMAAVCLRRRRRPHVAAEGGPRRRRQPGEEEAAVLVATPCRIEHRRQQVKRSRDFTDLQCTSRKAILHLDGVDPRARWLNRGARKSQSLSTA